MKNFYGSKIKDTRGEDTILVKVDTNVGKFTASAPNGKSKGKFEARPYIRSLNDDIKRLRKVTKQFVQIEFEDFNDLSHLDKLFEKTKIGANTRIALEYAILKALAKGKGVEIFELINKNIRRRPGPAFVANVIGGGKHSHSRKKPEFQEFHIITRDTGVLKRVYFEIEKELFRLDENFRGKKNDENAWETSLDNSVVLDLLKKLQNEYDLQIGVDIAASSFYKKKRYQYTNPKIFRKESDQFLYLQALIKKRNIFYVEDPFHEEDFDGFAELQKSYNKVMIVGDDLTVTNPERLMKAIQYNAIKGIIVKPNQIGSLLKVREVCETAKKHKIKIIFSHRSGETEENIIADLAYGFDADYVKFGADGKGRIEKIQRILEIRK